MSGVSTACNMQPPNAPNHTGAFDDSSVHNDVKRKRGNILDDGFQGQSKSEQGLAHQPKHQRISLPTSQETASPGTYLGASECGSMNFHHPQDQSAVLSRAHAHAYRSSPSGSAAYSNTRCFTPARNCSRPCFQGRSESRIGLCCPIHAHFCSIRTHIIRNQLQMRMSVELQIFQTACSMQEFLRLLVVSSSAT